MENTEKEPFDMFSMMACIYRSFTVVGKRPHAGAVIPIDFDGATDGDDFLVTEKLMKTIAIAERIAFRRRVKLNYVLGEPIPKNVTDVWREAMSRNVN